MSQLRYIEFNGKPGTTWKNEGAKYRYQMLVSWQRSCGVCIQYDRAIGPSWPIPFHFGCLLPDTKIIAPGASTGFRAMYDGPVCRITFSEGASFTVTQNHMLLTPTGFAAAKTLVEGEYVVRCPVGNGASRAGVDDHRKPTRIDDLFQSLAKLDGVGTIAKEVAAEDLHGDGRLCHGDVDVVTVNRFLGNHLQSPGFKEKDKGGFILPNLSPFPLPPESDLEAVFGALRDATGGSVNGLREMKSFRRAQLAQSQLLRLAGTSHADIVGEKNRANRSSRDPHDSADGFLALPGLVEGDNLGILDFGAIPAETLYTLIGPDLRAVGDESTLDGVVTDAQGIRDARYRFPGLVATDDCKIVRIETLHYRGPVYDVETSSSLYLLSNGVATSNCRCHQYPIPPNGTSKPFIDYREKIKTIDPRQQARIMGKSNLLLVQKGIVKWDDVVTEGRIRDFREVVSIAHLSVKDLTKAGVNPRIAKDAFAAVHTQAHVAAEESRRRIIEAMRAKGISDDEIRRKISERLAGRVTLGPLPPPPVPPPIAPPLPKQKPKPAPGIGKKTPLPIPVISKSLGVKFNPAAPGLSITQRLDAYIEGDAKAAEMAAIGQEVKEAFDLYQDVMSKVEALVDTMIAGSKEPGGPTAAAHEAFAEVQGLKVEAAKLKAELIARRETAADKARKILAVPADQRIAMETPIVDPTGVLTPDLRLRAATVAIKLEEIVAAKPGVETIRCAVKPLDSKTDQRAFFRKDFVGGKRVGAIHVENSETDPVIAHEFAHAIEWTNPKVHELIMEFLAHRCGNEPLQSLKTLFPDSKYRPDEVGRKDKFEAVFGERQAWYVGKKYPDSEGNSEVLSMGVEKLFEDPAGFALKDPELFKFVVGILHGVFH